MKHVSDKELEDYMKQALEKTPFIQPRLTEEEMWRKVKEKREKRKKRLQKIPVYASSFIAIVAIAFVFLQVPQTSDHLMVQNERKIADIDRAYQEIQTATTLIKEEVTPMINQVAVLKEYPTYIPTGYALIKEEFLEQGHVLTYEGEGKTLVVQTVYGDEIPQKIKMNTSVHQVEKKIENATLLVTGELSEEVLSKILASMY